MRRRVFIRGIGAYTPLGETWPVTAEALAAGVTAIAPVTGFDVSGFPCTVAAAMPGRCDDEDRRLAFARRAADEAWRMASVIVEPERIGVFVGAESGRGRFETVLGLARAAGCESSRADVRSAGAGGGPTRVAGSSRDDERSAGDRQLPFDHVRFGREARAFAERIDASVISPSSVASALAGELDAGGPVETISLACASAAAAIVEAARAIRLGVCDVALCGGVGADVDPLMLAGFGLLGALSARGVSRPFDAARDGFVVGEGAAMLVLASEAGAAACELAGIGRSLDAHHLTAPEPDGDGAARAMTAALEDAGVDAVDYVQAHGTSTPLNDAVEIAALRRALGDRFDRAHVGSVKGAVGHWVAGAGAIGALCAWEAVAHDLVLPTAGLADVDPACEARHVVGRAMRAEVRAALANAFAFGGANASIVIRRAG